MTDPFEKARSLLTPPVEAARPWSMLGAAALAAFAATLMAGVMVLGPGVSFEEPAGVAHLEPSSRRRAKALVNQ